MRDERSEFTGKYRDVYRVVLTVQHEREAEHKTLGYIHMPASEPQTVRHLSEVFHEQKVADEHFDAAAKLILGLF